MFGVGKVYKGVCLVMIFNFSPPRYFFNFLHRFFVFVLIGFLIEFKIYFLGFVLNFWIVL